MHNYEYGEREITHLTKRDKKLGAAMARLGKLEREVNPDLFEALVDSIVSQQISGKAAQTVFARLRALVGEAFTPGALIEAGAERIQSCGMSMRKAEYITGVAQAAASGELDLARLGGMSDAEVIRVLTALRGVGVWTAEMMLIFSLERPDVVSFLDLGIRRGMMNLYGLKDLTRERFERYRKRYAPYGTVASLYLWALAGE